MINNLNKILFYTMILVHTPWTMIRIFLATVLIIDRWCDKVLHGTLEDVKAEIEMEMAEEVICPNCSSPNIFRDPDDETLNCEDCWTTAASSAFPPREPQPSNPKH